MTVDPEKMARLRDRAARIESVPSWLRGAKDGLPAFEDRAVKHVVKWSGVGSIPGLKDEARRRGVDLFTFGAFHALFDFPVRLTAGRLLFHFDGIATQLFNDAASTPIWSAYDDARKTRPDGRLALVFNWARVRKCGGLCVFHDVPRDEAEVLARASRRKADPRLAFRLTVPVGGLLYHLEPLPAFLHAIGCFREATNEEFGGGAPADRD